MTRHDDTVSIRHMFDHAVEAVEMARGRSRADLDRDRQLNLALVRLVEIIGTRNRLIHGYDRVNFDFLCDPADDQAPREGTLWVHQWEAFLRVVYSHEILGKTEIGQKGLLPTSCLASGPSAWANAGHPWDQCFADDLAQSESDRPGSLRRGLRVSGGRNRDLLAYYLPADPRRGVSRSLVVV